MPGRFTMAWMWKLKEEKEMSIAKTYSIEGTLQLKEECFFLFIHIDTCVKQSK